MIGVYDYTVILTYLSLISAFCGITLSLSGTGHPYLGIFFLLFSGLLDAFDGIVARTKKNRTDEEKSFGIQIDSLADLVAFGVLPACIGIACLKVSPFAESMYLFNSDLTYWYVKIPFVLIALFYVLAALIRLAHFNVAEEIRQKSESGVRKFYTGLPVTSSAIIFPTLMLVQYLIPADLSFLYMPLLLITGLCFILKFRIPKMSFRGVLITIGICLIECIALGIFILSK